MYGEAVSRVEEDLSFERGRAIFLRAIWGWDDSHIFIGNMKRGVDVISPTLEKTIFNLQSPHMSAVPRRFDAHPLTVGMLAGGTCLGQVFMWTLT
ncbi:hypothetical protein ACB092_05G027600 [Castanea dentata]